MWDLIVSGPDHCLSFYFPSGEQELPGKVFAKSIQLRKDTKSYKFEDLRRSGDNSSSTSRKSKQSSDTFSSNSNH